MDVRLDSYGALQVEPTDACDLACAMCEPHRSRKGAPHGIPAGRMDFGLYRHVLEGMARDGCRFDHLILQWMGEPALHPNLPMLVGTAARLLRGRLGYVRVDTNGLSLTPGRVEALLDAWLPASDTPLLLVFSLDAASPEAYARVKGVDAWHRAARNVRHLVDLRARRAPGHPLNIQLQFVVQEGNAHEAGDFLRYWEAFLGCRHRDGFHDQVLFKRLSVGAGGPGQAAADALYDETIERFHIQPRPGPPVEVVVWPRRPWRRDEATSCAPTPRGPCPGPWMTPVIRHDGLISPCCVDLEGRLALGNARDGGFKAAWEGDVAHRLRLAHVLGDLSAYPLCQSCGGIGWYGFPHDVVRRWLEGVGRPDAWPAYQRRMGLTGPGGEPPSTPPPRWRG